MKDKMKHKRKYKYRYQYQWILLGLTVLLSAGCGAEKSDRIQETLKVSAGENAIESSGEIEITIGTAREDVQTVAGDMQTAGDEAQTSGEEAQTASQEPSRDVQETGSVAAGVTEFTFADVEGREFYFSSGAGAWYEVLYIHGDGTFEGHFQDSDMGMTGEGYPNGTLLYSDYTGTFTKPQRLDETTWTFRIDSIQYANPVGMEEIKDQTLYTYTDSYGLGKALDLYLYLPGSDIAGLPEEYRSWVGYYNLEAVKETKLPFYGLYNVNNQTGFSSYEYDLKSAYSQVWDEIGKAEAQADELQRKLQNARTQMEINQISGEIYTAWDDTLNTVWGILKANLEPAVMERLTEEERAWIAKKDEAVKAAAAEAAGGSMEPTERNMEAAKLTKERVYELAEYLSPD